MIKYVTIILLFVTISTYSQEEKHVHEFMDQWHLAAAEANGDAFFTSIAEDGVYIGTDASERWDKAAFLKFAKPYFDKGKAWAFTPYDRQIFISEDGNFAWFSELLNTWMGVCRGSGVLKKTANEWKIKQYHLSVTVPNDAVQDFISLVDSYNKEQK